MARGGRRPGSGRPSRFNVAQERIWCYAEYFVVRDEYQSVGGRRYWEQLKKSEKYSALEEARADLDSIPISDRSLVLAEEELAGRLERKREAIEDALDAARHSAEALVAEVRRLTRGRSCPCTSPRCHHLPRFYKRREIFDEVARRACTRFGRRITADEIETNWKFMRAKLTN